MVTKLTDQLSCVRIRMTQWGYAEGNSSIKLSPHCHDYYQAHFSLGGVCNLHTSKGDYVLQNHDLIFISPGIAHQLNYPERYLCYCCKFKASLPFMPDILYLPSDDFTKGVIEIARMILEMTFPKERFGARAGAMILPGDHYQMLMEYYLTGLLSQLLYQNNEEKLPHQILDILQGNPGVFFSVAEAAEACRYSRGHFSRLIKAATGLSARDFLMNLRLKRAQKLLHYSNLNIGEIAEQLGFSNQFHFSDFFKRLTGSSPLQYRQKCSQ